MADAADGARAAGALTPRAIGLADGRVIVVRTATVADLAGIVDFFERLSARSRYARFFSPQPRMRRVMIERIVAPGADRMTVLAQPTEFRATRHDGGVARVEFELPRRAVRSEVGALEPGAPVPPSAGAGVP